MIWFLTFGKNGSAGMPAVPATILMSDSKGFKTNFYATKIVVPLESDHEIKDQILVHQVPTSHGFKR